MAGSPIVEIREPGRERLGSSEIVAVGRAERVMPAARSTLRPGQAELAVPPPPAPPPQPAPETRAAQLWGRLLGT
ncbi:MAG TPA: hypothetical protein VK586_23660 [Streptosporangiaceae bacterium]|nr:hypothetical protein [Streptosporangiaceae bacterium]